MGRIRRVGSVKSELLSKSKEAALTAVKVFNDPLIMFKSETFIVLMIISWTYLLHAYFRSQKIEYRYYEEKNGRKSFYRTKRRAFKYWELERCLNEKNSPIDSGAANNLKFLIGLRHEIEHQMTCSLDDYLSARYQACILNFNMYLKKLFGDEYGLDKNLSFSLQFLELTDGQSGKLKMEEEIPDRLRQYIEEFDLTLTQEQLSDPKFSIRYLFTKQLVNRKGQADRVVEFVDPNSEIAQAIEKEHWVKKDTEKKKFLPSQVVKEVQDSGFKGFRLHEHTLMCQAEKSKDPGKGFGADVAGKWFWYQCWIDKCIKECEVKGDLYRPEKPSIKAAR